MLACGRVSFAFSRLWQGFLRNRTMARIPRGLRTRKKVSVSAPAHRYYPDRPLIAMAICKVEFPQSSLRILT